MRVSRLARDRRTYWELKDAIVALGCRPASPTIEYGEDAASQFREGLEVEFSQYESRSNGERTIGRMKARLEAGYAVFAAPVGYRYRTITRQGKMLKREVPAATVVKAALEDYANGVLETQADVVRVLQDNPLFPKDSTGIVRHSRVGEMLANCVYAGLVESPKWGLSRRQGLHEGLISVQTFQRIQDRLSGASYAPRRRNLDESFPLRGFVVCADCGTPLTACWSTGKTKRHAYYLCPKRGCASYGKSIRKDQIEGGGPSDGDETRLWCTACVSSKRRS